MFFAISLHAQKIVLTAESSVAHALENNISIQQNEIKLDASKRDKRWSWNSASPSASASANYSKAVPGKENSKDSVSFNARVSTSLSPSLPTQIKSARLSYEQQKISYDNAVSSITLSVLKAYYNILYNIENLGLLRKNLETKKSQYESNLSRYNRGMLNRVDVLSAQINYQNSELNVHSQEINLENLVAQFKQAIGIAQDAEIEFSGDFNKVLSLEKIDISDLEKKSSSIEAIEKQIELERNSLASLRLNAYGPSLTAGYSYSSTYNTKGFEKTSDGGTISVGASIPLDGIFPWSKNSLSIESQKDNIKNLELKLKDEKTGFGIRVDSLVKKINQGIDNIKVRKSSIELAETNYKMTLEAYNHGTRDLLTLQAAQDNLLSSRVNLVSEANALVSSIHELENECGWEYGSLLGEKK